ncbi:MAG: ABC transporter substrate-binding protein [Actinomycetota bacterium]|nr:ABC transporter substrate-binding protein [Actinomycetota bacterium]
MNRPRRQATLLALLLAFALTAAGACGGGSDAGSAGAGSASAIRLGFSAWPGWFPWQVAKEKGFFDKAGVNVDLVWFESYTDSLNALSGGKLDANSQTLNDTISSVAAGADQVVVLVNDNSTGNDQIIVRSGIDNVADLKGKKVGIEEGTVDHFLLLLGLDQAGLKAGDVQLQPLPTDAAAAAFAAGQLDAVGAFAPFTTKALEREGARALFTSADFPGAIPDHLVVNRSLLERRAGDVQRLVDAWFDTIAWISANREEAVAIMAERAGVSVEDYRAYDEGTRIFTLEENLAAFEPGDGMSHPDFAARRIARFLEESRLAKGKPDLTRLFDARFVNERATRS